MSGKEVLLFQRLLLSEFDILILFRPGRLVQRFVRSVVKIWDPSRLCILILPCHAVRDNRLTTRPSFQRSRCSGVFRSAGGLHRHVCSSGDKLLEARQIGTVAATVGRPPPVHWVIATDGSASPSSVEAPASAGWAFVQREGLLEGPEVECSGEVLVDDKDPRALGAESLTTNAAEL